jgi:hypothetical protein
MQQAQDISGYELFCTGDRGDAHVTAHRMLDAGSHELGYRLLDAWLARNEGAGSEWIHLQWHMLVFELALGRLGGARTRFDEQILPAATSTADALCDAPAALWRISLAAPEPTRLPWMEVRATALAQMRHAAHHPYVELHNLLALAGAGDTSGLDEWLDRHATRAPLLRRMAVGLRAFAAGNYRYAAAALAAALPRISELGGSRAQNELFHDIARTALDRCTPQMLAA